MDRAIGLALDPSRPEPLYVQLVEQVTARARSGAFPPGFRLPPTRELARALRVHRNTVVRAFEELVAAGVVTSRVGSGTFVAAPPRRAEAPQAEAPRLPWESLLSRGARAEALRRFDRLARSVAPGAAAAGREVIDLQRLMPPNDLMPLATFRRCVDHVLRIHGGRVLGYAPREGLPRLRRLIAEHLAEAGVPARADDVLVTTGSQQAIDLVVRALVDPGDAFLVEAATYPGALNLLAAAGAQAIAVPCDDEGPDLDFLRRLPRGRVKGFYLMPSCHNPTGARISGARRQALLAWSRLVGVPLVEDDYGRGLVLDEASDEPAALRALDPEVVYVGTFSKKLIPALRVGFVVCPPGLAERLVPLKHAMDLSSSLLLQHALAEFLERGYLRAHLRRTLPEYRRRVGALEAALRAHLPEGVAWRRPAQGLATWLSLPASVEPDALFDEALRRGVLVGPGSLHLPAGAPARGAHGVRLTFCAEPPERLTEGARRLGEAVRALLARRPAPRPEHEVPALGVV
ncbi:MAG: PLP-dependent aminotransferase family protein [Planctomycetes bacterium]|nr:PLP-dependent aminotransferase family protein [Planctomycetota bacterium]